MAQEFFTLPPHVSPFVLLLAISLAFVPAPGASVVDSVPFLLENGRPTVEVTIDGDGPHRFIFDTGADRTVIDAALASRLGLAVIGTDELGAPGLPTQPTDVVEAELLALGPLRLEGVSLSTLDLGGVAAGVLAPRSLPGGRVTLDFPGRRLSVGGAPLDPSAADTVAFESPEGLIALSLAVGGATVTAHLDTGSPGGLMMPKHLADRFPMHEAPREIGRARLIGGESAVFSARLDGDAAAGALHLEDPEISILDLPLPAANLGSALLTGFVLEIDYDRSLVRFVPSAPALGTQGVPQVIRRVEGERRRLGIAMAPGPPGPNGLPLVDGGLAISGVDPGSLAEAVDLRAGDRILAVNGVALEELDIGGLSVLFGGDESLRIEFDRAGTQHTVTIDGP